MRTSIRRLLMRPALSGEKLVPFYEGGVTLNFEGLSAVDVSI